MANFIAPVVICVCFPLLLRGFRRDPLGWVLTGLLLTAGAAWLIAFLAVTFDFRGSDGFIDCWPGCTTWQDGVGWTFWLSGIAFAALLLVITLRGVWEMLRK